MNDQPSQFRQLIAQVQLGSHEAARQLADTYGPHVRRYVHRALSRDLRSQYDSLDFVQLVWASFFDQPEDLPPIESPAQLVSYLVRMAQHKLLDEVRRQHAQKNDVQREERLILPDEQIASRDPTPSAVAIFNEQWENLVDRQPADVGRVVQMRYEGATYREIADELKINERTARKAIDRLGQNCEQHQADADTDEARSPSANRESLPQSSP